MAGHQRRVSFGYLAMCMCSTRAFDDLMRVNPFIAATHHHPLHLLGKRRAGTGRARPL